MEDSNISQAPLVLITGGVVVSGAVTARLAAAQNHDCGYRRQPECNIGLPDGREPWLIRGQGSRPDIHRYEPSGG